MRTGDQETSPGPSPGGTLCWGPPGATISAPVLPPRADTFPPGTANPQGWGWVRGARVKVRVGVRVRVRVSNGVTTGCHSTIPHPIRCPTPTVSPPPLSLCLSHGDLRCPQAPAMVLRTIASSSTLAGHSANPPKPTPQDPSAPGWGRWHSPVRGPWWQAGLGCTGPPRGAGLARCLSQPGRHSAAVGSGGRARAALRKFGRGDDYGKGKKK